jgi:hypothetical protein
MLDFLATLALPVLFAADYIAIVVWLTGAGDKPDERIRFRLRSLLIATTIVAIHLALISAFLRPPLIR